MLDAIQPRYHHRERHTLQVDAPAADVIAAVETVTWSDLPLFRALIAVSTLGRRQPATAQSFLTQMTSGGFRYLARSDDEIVVGAVAPVLRKGTPVTLGSDPARRFADFDEPGYYRVAFNFRHARGELSTETRVAVTDEASRRAFAAYWHAVRIPGGLIRHEWLRAVRRRALSAPASGSGTS